MTTYEQLLAQGRAEGKIQGKIEGKIEGQRELVAKLLRGALEKNKKVSANKVDALVERLASCDDEVLEQIARLLLESKGKNLVTTLEELLPKKPKK